MRQRLLRLNVQTVEASRKIKLEVTHQHIDKNIWYIKVPVNIKLTGITIEHYKYQILHDN